LDDADEIELLLGKGRAQEILDENSDDDDWHRYEEYYT